MLALARGYFILAHEGDDLSISIGFIRLAGEAVAELLENVGGLPSISTKFCS